MCGIAGIMYKHGGDGFDTGTALIDMLDGCQHRGPDSTGYALYGEAHEGQLKLPVTFHIPFKSAFLRPIQTSIHCPIERYPW